MPCRIAVALLLLACAPGPPVPRWTQGASAVRVATWNVHDLFDEVDRLAPPGEADTVPAHAEVEAKLDRLAAVLARLGADVVLLQEVEDLAVLQRLAARAGYPEARLVEGRDPRGIDVAALSRLPVLAYQSHLGDLAADGSWLWPRDCVELHVDAGGWRLVLVGTHLVSRLSDAGARRAEQAARLRQIADAAAERYPGALVLVGGDLNDLPDAPSLAPLLADGAWIDPAAGLPGDQAWTWSSGGARERIDYLLVDGRAAGLSTLAWVEGGEEVAAASDHRPAVLDLAFHP